MTITWFDQIKKDSEEYMRDFNKNLGELEMFEENVHSVNKNLGELEYISKHEFYLVSGDDMSVYTLSDKSINDILAKSKFSISKKSFNEVEQLTDYQGLKLGEHILRNSAQATDKPYKLILYENAVRAVQNKNFPIDTFKINRLVSALQDYAYTEGRDIKMDVDFNVDSGNARMDMFTDFTSIPLQQVNVNDEVGFGVSLLNNYYGKRRFEINTASLNLACNNGLLQKRTISNLSIVHSSVKNISVNISKWIYNNKHFKDLTRRETAIYYWMKNGKFPTEEYDYDFYRLFSKTIFEIIDRRKEEQIEMFLRAEAKTIEDIEKELEKLGKQFKIPKSHVESISFIFDNDDTIDQNHKNDYTLSLAFSRFANSKELNSEQREMYQELASEIIAR